MRLIIKLAACTVFAYGLAAYMTVPGNPEIQFWKHVDECRDRELETIRKSSAGEPVLLFTGGSSCAFSIAPEIIEKTCGIPALNLGLPFSAGPKYLLDQALNKARKGDFVIVALEPDAIVYRSDFPPSSFSFGLAAIDGNPSAAVGKSTFGDSLALRDYLNYSRPGPTYTATWLGKSFTGKGYRYTHADIRYRGRIETPITMPSLPASSVIPPSEISESGKTLLSEFKSSATARGVTVAYCMPWLLASDKHPEKIREANQNILESVQQVMPVIDDGFHGVATDPSYFSDTPLHLSAKGSVIRSQAVADALRKWMTTR